MKMYWKQIVLAFIFISFPIRLLSQTKIISPLPNAIIQKVNGLGLLRVSFVSQNFNKISLQIKDSLGNSIPNTSITGLSFHNNILDTSFAIPVLKNFTLTWQTFDGLADSGSIRNLAVGHVYGIAGQSNAQGWSPPPFVSPQGDIRMLRNDSGWQKGEDPTGGMYASPWIQFSIKLQELLRDSLPIGLVNVAVGGTGLVNKTGTGWWQRNETWHSDTSSIYGKAIAKFLKVGQMEAMFWIQGESDCVGIPKSSYVAAFKRLVNNFEEDVQKSLKVFHLQISGQIGNKDKVNWGIIREAQRDLPPSTLVGTAVGSLIGWDGIHYASVTEIMVGDRFAGAVAGSIHNIPNNLASPLLPQNSAIVKECVSGDPYQGYKIVLGCTKDGNPGTLKVLDTLRGFQIRANGVFLDTSKIFAKVEPNDLSKIDIFVKDLSLSPDKVLQLSYAITADISNVNVSDTDSSTVFPNYLVSFMDIPISSSPASVADSFTISQNTPNPFNQQTHFYICLKTLEHITYSVNDISGRTMISKDMGMLSEGNHSIQIDKADLASGIYEVVFKFGNDLKSFKIIIF